MALGWSFAVMTLHPQSLSNVEIAFSIRSSLSITITVILVLSLLMSSSAVSVTFTGFFCSNTRGISTLKHVPLPTSECSDMLISNNLAIRSHIAKPSPNPGISRVSSKRSNSQKIACCLSSGIPGPLSQTWINKACSSRLTPNNTLGTNSVLLVSTFALLSGEDVWDVIC